MDEREHLRQLVDSLPADPVTRIAALGALCEEVDHLASVLLTSPAGSPSHVRPPAHRAES